MDVPLQKIAMQEKEYEAFFGGLSLWKLASHEDPNLRKSVYTLLQTCLANHRSEYGGAPGRVGLC